MTELPTPDYRTFDALDSEHLDALAEHSDYENRPDYTVGQGVLDSVHLALTALGIKPA